MIKLEWLDTDNTQLKWIFAGEWTAREFYRTLAKTHKMIQTQSRSVTIILDLSEGNAPENLLELAKFGLQAPMKQVKQIIIVGYIPTWKSIYSILLYMVGEISVPIKFVSQLNEAKVN